MSLGPPMQLTLFDAPGEARPSTERRAAALAHRLSDLLREPVRLTLTDNRATLISFRRHPEALCLRLHHLFLDAPDEVVRALVAFVSHKEHQAREALEAYAREHNARVRRTRRPGAPLKARGQCFNLRALYERLNATYFEGRIQAEIGWARRPGRLQRKSIRLGVYDARLREIRIHPALDQPHVPAFVVEAILFHAMLHQLFPEEPDGGPPSHPPAFLERERTFPLLDAARRWQREHLRALLRGEQPRLPRGRRISR